jgi:hypothetical protein
VSARWEAVSLRSVRKPDVMAGLADLGIEWRKAGHVTATRTLARAIEQGGDAAVPISTLVDYTVFAGMPGDWKLDPPQLPLPTDGERTDARRMLLDEWGGKVIGRTLSMDLRAQGVLRRLVRDGGVDPAIGRSLIAGRQQLLRGVRQLVSAGFAPEHLLAGDDTLLDGAAAFWSELESQLPAMTQVRSDLWPERTRSGSVAAGLKERLTDALNLTVGEWSADRTVVHHGFHFYTPVQWAMFRVLREVAEVHQVFVVHVDGESPVFESWRRFFDTSLDMPDVDEPTGGRAAGPAAVALTNAIGGRRIDASAVSGELDVYRTRNVAELARLVRSLRIDADTNGRRAPELFAPGADDFGRSLRRIGGESSLDQASLGHLPVGTFLSGLHRCIRADRAIEIASEDFLDLASTGLLGDGTISDSSTLAALRRALVFFGDCRTPDEWRRRATTLVELVAVQVPAVLPRDVTSDESRIQSSAQNPLLRLPWLDISVAAAESIAQAVESIAELTEHIAATEQVRLREHLALVDRYLRSGLVLATREEQQRVRAQIDGLKTGLDEEVDVEALVDVVNVLLGRQMESDFLGEETPGTAGISELLGLDARGYAPIERDVHVTNLSDDAFPGAAQGLAWPFRHDAIDPTGGLGIAADILQTRVEVAAASDLYLLWLALDGVEGSARVQLSYVEQFRGEPRNPSPVLALLTRPRAVSKTVASHVGGADVSDVPTDPRESASVTTGMQVRVGDLRDAGTARRRLASLDHRAVASTFACARRFVVQWLLGDSAAHTATHHHAMLYGNVLAALITNHDFRPKEAQELCDRVWAHLTVGERRSSLEKSVVRSSLSSRARAHPTWNLTLNGSKGGRGRLDMAYNLAMHVPGPERDRKVDLIADHAMRQPALLPKGVGEALSVEEAVKICDSCPVRSRCRQRRFEADN